MTRTDRNSAEIALARAIRFANEGSRYWAVRWFAHAVDIAEAGEQRDRAVRFAAAYRAAA